MSLWHPTKPAYPIQDNAYDLGSATLRWKNAYLAQRLYFGTDEYLYRYMVGVLGTPNALKIDGSLAVGGDLTLSGNLNGFDPDAHASRHEYGGSDLVANLDHLTIAGIAVLDSNRKVQCSLFPYTDASIALGSSSLRWSYFYAVTKNAAFKHPLHNPERYIVFKCTESPKVTVEDWGIAELENGKAFVGFSEEFVALMSDKAEYAVFLTPEGECSGLYVSKKEFYGFEVKELNNGKSNIRFSWHVKAIRIGDEETPVLEEPAPTEPEKQEEWEAKRREADKKKEENRLNRMKQKIAKYREVLSKS
jgi:hypothetical protein